MYTQRTTVEPRRKRPVLQGKPDESQVSMYYRNIFSWTYYWKINRYVGVMHRTGCLFWGCFSSFFCHNTNFVQVSGLRSQAEMHFGKESPSPDSGVLMLTRLRQLYIHHEMLRRRNLVTVWRSMVGMTCKKKIWEGFSPLIKNKNYILGENAHSCHWLWDIWSCSSHLVPMGSK